MVNKIERASSLPSWFSLDKYSQANNLDAAGWYKQLSLRLGILNLISRYPWDIWGSDVSQDSKLVIYALQAIRTNAIPSVENDYRLSMCLHSGLELKSVYAFGVHQTTVREHYLTEHNMAERERDYARNFFAQIFDDEWSNLDKDIEFKYPHQDWIDSPIDNLADPAEANISVNLLLPDKVLMEQFKNVLNDLRKPLQHAGVVLDNKHKPDFTSWLKFGVLPYLDLYIWKKETGFKIPNRVMADAIFPPGEGGEEVVRKTTEKICRELMTGKYLQMLAAIAADEIAERNHV